MKKQAPITHALTSINVIAPNSVILRNHKIIVSKTTSSSTFLKHIYLRKKIWYYLENQLS